MPPELPPPPLVVDQLDQDPTIKLIFQGLLLAHLEKDSAQVGAIVSDECHRPKISITKKEAGKYSHEINLAKLFDVQDNAFTDDFRLDVFGPESGISVFQKGAFDRKNNDSDPKDFRWFIDLEKEILQVTEPAPIDTNSVFPVFRVKNAVFYSAGPHEAKCAVQRANGTEDFGFITPALMANIKLDEQSNAVLMSGDSEVLTIYGADLAGATYEILFDCECPCGPQPKDAGGGLQAAAATSVDSDFKMLLNVVQLDPNAIKDLDLRKDTTEEEGAAAKSFNHEVPCVGAQSATPLRKP